MSAATYPLVPRLRIALVRDEPEGASWPALDAPSTAVRWLQTWVRAEGIDDGREHFGVLMLDARHKLIGLHVVSVGCLTASLVHPREVFGPAMLAKACALVLWHTHPSGDPEPSAEDLALTRRLAAGGSLLGMEVLDHVVLGMGGAWRWVSMKDRGIL